MWGGVHWNIPHHQYPNTQCANAKTPFEVALHPRRTCFSSFFASPLALSAATYFHIYSRLHFPLPPRLTLLHSSFSGIIIRWNYTSLLLSSKDTLVNAPRRLPLAQNLSASHRSAGCTSLISSLLSPALLMHRGSI